MASSCAFTRKRQVTSSGSMKVSAASSSKSSRKSIESAYSMYMLDSLNISQEQENSFQVYSFRNDEWHAVTEKMNPRRYSYNARIIPFQLTSIAGDLSVRYNFAVASYRDRIWVVGGEIGPISHRQSVNAVVVFNPRSGRWEDCLSMIYRRHSLCAAVLGNYLYAVGGLCDDTALNYVEVWRGQIWETCHSMHFARYRFAVGVGFNRIYAVGSMTPEHTRLSNFEYYSPYLDCWEKREIRCARGGNEFAIAVANEKLYAFVGGRRPRQITVFNPRNPSMIAWTRPIAPFPEHIHSYDVAALNGMVYLVGQKHRESYFASFHPDTMEWTTLTKPLGQDLGLVKIAIIRNTFEG